MRRRTKRLAVTARNATALLRQRRAQRTRSASLRGRRFFLHAIGQQQDGSKHELAHSPNAAWANNQKRMTPCGKLLRYLVGALPLISLVGP